MPVTVDLPLVPPTAMPSGAALNSSASSSGRAIRGAPSSAARTTSGTVSSIAAEVTTIWSAPVMPLPSCGKRAMPRAAQEFELGREPALVERAVGARDPVPAALHDQRQRQHAAAADAAEEIGFGLAHAAALLGE